VSLAAKGYITVAPDLLGLGDHEGIHPYIHAASEAWVARDMMRAARQYAADNQVFINDQVFLTGYSQGGHSTLALHRMLEEELPGEFVVTASAPMSGPYSISQVMYNLIVSGSIYDKPGYLINTFISYQAVYGDVYADIASTFKAPYQPFIEAFANNEISLSQLDSALLVHLLLNEGMVVPVRVLKDDFVNAVMTQPDHPMRLAMEQNDVYDWAPLAPTRLMYCTADEEVPYENSTVAEAAMLANGAADVEAVVISPFLNHFLCALPAAVQTADFFSEYQLVEEVNLSAGRIPSGELLVCPNPLTGNRLTLKGIAAAGRLSIADMGGRVVFFHPVSEGNNLLWLPGLPAGVYSLKVVLPQYTRSQKLVVASR
ncbi:MAG TPA: T9SS type A sorting domain-containing protein, partial [Bacteroidetes bacterium]|nr:T9SS type A sorting domain-containing protein [Bacteroidota bacterium]